MKLENQVCNLELSRRLKELGVKQDGATFYWVANLYNPDEPWTPSSWSLLTADEAIRNHAQKWGEKKTSDYIFTAFTVSELGEMLPLSCWESRPYLCKGEKRWCCGENLTIENRGCHANTEADARAKMLIHLIEQGIVKAKELK